MLLNVSFDIIKQIIEHSKTQQKFKNYVKYFSLYSRNV